MELAREAIEQSRSKRRAKYEAYGRVTLALAMVASAERDALGELYAATATAERLENPALHVMSAAALLGRRA